MELPSRDRGDELLRAGELTDIRRRLRRLAARIDLATVIVCAFDRRTRMLPFIYADMRMAPGGARAIGAALVESGLPKTRIVLQQWNRNFRPSRMRLDGKVPDLLLISSTQIHSAQCEALIRDACRIDPAHRPLIVTGGPQSIYQPWSVFGSDPLDPWGADAAVTGEEYVLLSLLEMLLSVYGRTESLRTTFLRARNSGLLDDIPGLVYPRTFPAGDGVATELVDTGIQRMVGDLDELPHPAAGYRLLEPPGRRPTLSSRALPGERVARYTPLGSLVLTSGCRFACPYCPIPAYTQRQHRQKSGERIADEMARLWREYGMRFFFGADDNFFDDNTRALEIVETLARADLDGAPLGARIRWATEVTVRDTLRMKQHLPVVARAGVAALWMGVEDMTATLIRKGQSVDTTAEVFRLLWAQRIQAMPMMMHHDSQPLYTPGSSYGLLNQVRLLRKAGAVDMQVLMLTPAVGSRQYDEAFESGLVFDSAGGRRVELYMFDGNYVVASGHKRPWRKQLNILAAHLWFYNAPRAVTAVRRAAPAIGWVSAVALQVIWIWGMLHTIRRTLAWAMRLLRGGIRRAAHAPAGSIPMRSCEGSPASHALPHGPGPRSILAPPRECYSCAGR